MQIKWCGCDLRGPPHSGRSFGIEFGMNSYSDSGVNVLVSSLMSSLIGVVSSICCFLISLLKRVPKKFNIIPSANAIQIDFICIWFSTYAIRVTLSLGKGYLATRMEGRTRF